jgi:N-acetylmuramoyl-L-alanine amidase
MKKFLQRRHILAYAFFYFLLAIQCEAQSVDSVRVSVAGKNGAEGFVRSLSRPDASYLSINGVAHLLGLSSYYNPILKKLEVNFDLARIKFTANDPFFIVTDHATLQQTVLQFPAPVLDVHDTLFAPLPFFVTLANSVSNLPMQVEATPAALESTTVAKAANVTGISFSNRKNGVLIRIFATQKFPDISRFVRNDDWLYVTIPNGWADTLALDATKPNDFMYQLVAVQSPTSLQLSFHMKQKFEAAEVFQDSATNDILATLRMAVIAMPKGEDSLWAKDTSKTQPRSEAVKDSFAVNPNTSSATNSQASIAATQGSPVEPEVAENNGATEIHEAKREALQPHKEMLDQLRKKKERWKFDVVVLDPGHGGKDPGCIGTIGTREKDITLGIALKLGKLINRYLPSVKVVYTRQTDHFVELYRRGQIANENQGKLFISIHCNSMDQKPSPTHGFEIYLLRPGKTQDAINIAKEENSVVQLEPDYQDRYQEITEENFIILTMAQSAYMHNSEQFAEILQQEMSRNLFSKSHSVRQAGFYVLVGASMPNVLIETGYLSNRKDEMFLRSPEGQEKIAEDILRAIERYKKEYEKSMGE